MRFESLGKKNQFSLFFNMCVCACLWIQITSMADNALDNKEKKKRV